MDVKKIKFKSKHKYNIWLYKLSQGFSMPASVIYNFLMFTYDCFFFQAILFQLLGLRFKTPLWILVGH